MVASNFECTGNEHNVSDCERTMMKSHKDCLSKRAAEAKCERGPFVMDADKPYSPPVSVVIKNINKKSYTANQHKSKTFPVLLITKSQDTITY